jgi:hypothetical protein
VREKKSAVISTLEHDVMDRSYSVNHYHSAQERFLKPSVMQFFAREFPHLFGPIVREKIADALLSLFASNCPDIRRLRHGQLVWNALDKDTRGDAPNRRFVPVILSLVTEDDVQELENGVAMSRIAGKVIGRIITEAYEQGGILSMRDIALITARHGSSISKLRKEYEQIHHCVLPHTGTEHDMGSCITHKTMILEKILLEHKDPAAVARECHHSQQAVDRYLKDYYRVVTAYGHTGELDYIHHVTGLSRHLIRQYLGIMVRVEEKP